MPSNPVDDYPSVGNVITTANARLSCMRQRNQQGREWMLVAQESHTGKTLWSQPLSAEPVRWAIALDAQGRIIVALHNGQVLCFGG